MCMPSSSSRKFAAVAASRFVSKRRAGHVARNLLKLDRAFQAAAAHKRRAREDRGPRVRSRGARQHRLISARYQQYSAEAPLH